MMSLLYTAETEIDGSCGTKRIGLPTFDFEKAKERALDSSVYTPRRAYVFGAGGCVCAVFENGDELPPEQW